MPPRLRKMYVTGAFEALSTITVPERAPIARYYNDCVAKVGLTTGKLVENMKQYVETQPDLQKKPVPRQFLCANALPHIVARRADRTAAMAGFVGIEAPSPNNVICTQVALLPQPESVQGARLRT